MAIYFFLYFTLALSLLLYKNKNQERRIAYIFLIVFMILGISRSLSVGTDNQVYSMNFNSTTINPGTWSKYTEFEVGFNVLIVFFKNFISKDYYIFMSFLYVMWIIAYYRYTKIFGNGYLLSMFLSMGLLQFFTPYNIMRQYFALSLYSFVLPLLIKRRIWAYAIACVCVGFLFHRSVIVLAVVGILFIDKLNFIFSHKKVLITVVFLSYFLNFFSDMLLNFFNAYIGFFDLLGDRYSGYISHAEFEDEKGSKLSALLDTIIACVAIYSLNEKNKFYKLSVIFLSCNVLIQNILGPLFVIFLRIAIHFGWMKAFVFSSIINNNSKKYNLAINCIIYLYCFIIFTKAVLKNYGDIVPYVERFYIF